MGLFSAAVSGATPLKIQLTPAATRSALVVEAFACGETNAGTASRPVLVRPPTAGTGSGTATPRYPGDVSTSSVVTSFVTSPSLPLLTTLTKLPIRFHYVAPKVGGLVVSGSVALLFYAAAVGHAWTGDLVWEEL